MAFIKYFNENLSVFSFMERFKTNGNIVIKVIFYLKCGKIKVLYFEQLNYKYFI